MTQEIDLVQKEAFNVLKKDMLDLIQKNESSTKLTDNFGLTDEYTEDWFKNRNVPFFKAIYATDTFTEEVKVCLEKSETINELLFHFAMDLKFKDILMSEIRKMAMGPMSGLAGLLMQRMK